MRPKPGSAAELAAFAELQGKFPDMYRRLFPNPLEPRTVVVVPSLSMDQELISKITGVLHYEERLLCLLMLLRLPRTRIVYVTSTPIDPTIISYYLRLLTGVPGTHARKRLVLLSCHDASSATLSEKILSRPRLLRRIREAIVDRSSAHMSCFNVSATERTLAVQLGIPIYGCDPELSDIASKSGSREVLREAGVRVPEGFERLRDEKDLIEGLARLKEENPDMARAAVKLEEGASGEGNAVFSFADCPTSGSGDLRNWVRDHLPVTLRFEAAGEVWDSYRDKFNEIGGIVERWIDLPDRRSPSVQCRLDPIGGAEPISTHDQVLGGPSGQIFLGCTFPADRAYRREIQELGVTVAKVLRQRKVLGRFGVDFVSAKTQDGWEHYGIEINARKGGTTHPYMTLQFLADGQYDPETCLYMTPTGDPRYYYATDNLQSDDYRRLIPEDLIDIAVEHDLHFHGARQQGVAFHLIGALSEFGKLGVLCVADGRDTAISLYRRTVDTLDKEARL